MSAKGRRPSLREPPIREGLRSKLGFLGFDFRRVRSLRGAWRAHYTPKLKKRTALLRKLKDVFRRHQSQPVDRVVNLINPVLRGWVNYFAVGHASECFGFWRDGGKEDQAPFDASPEPKGLRLGAVE